MKKALLLFFAVWMIPAGLLSCASSPYSQWKSSSGKVIALVNGGGDASLAELTETPFLFDGEIIMTEKDVSMIWKNIHEAGFRFEEALEAESVPVSSSDYSLFADTMEVKIWFEKYLPEEAALLKIKAENGLYYMILGEKKWIDAGDEAEEPLSFGIYGRMGNFRPGIYLVSDSHTGGSSKKGYPTIYGFKGPVGKAGVK